MKKTSRDRTEGQKARHVPRYKLLICCMLSLFLGVALAVAVFFVRLGPEGLSLVQASNIVRARFVGDYDWTKSVDTALAALTDSLGDRWSYYLNEAEYERTKENRSNSYTGIGVTISRDVGDRIKIISVKAETPAARAGIQAGESIRAVNGTTVTAENWEDMLDAISGEAGTELTLQIEGADAALRELKLTRETLLDNPVSYELLPEQLGYVSIRNFYSGSGADMIAAVDDLVSQGAQGIVFDLRNNPGGYVDELTKMLDHLLPERVIFRSCNLGGEERLYHSDAEQVDLPFAVLVNADSYSAAEFFAAELRESTGAFLSGEQTSGKGFSQQLFPLQNGGALGISTARYFTGDGVSLIGTGLVPDALVPLSDEARRLLLQEQLPHEQDMQLQAARQALKNNAPSE